LLTDRTISGLSIWVNCCLIEPSTSHLIILLLMCNMC